MRTQQKEVRISDNLSSALPFTDCFEGPNTTWEGYNTVGLLSKIEKDLTATEFLSEQSQESVGFRVSGV